MATTKNVNITELFDNMQKGLLHYLKDDDVKVFYDKNFNPFLDNLYEYSDDVKQKIFTTIKLLKYLEKKNIKKVKKDFNEEISENKYFSDENTKTIQQYKQVLKKRLDYLLYSIYATEVKNKYSFFNYSPPFFDEVSKYALEHRYKNFEKYKQIYEFNTSKHSIRSHRQDKKTIFMQNYVPFENIINGQLGTSIRANSNFLIDENLQDTLIKNVKKTPLFDGYNIQISNQFEYSQRYLVGYYEGKSILFSEVRRKQKDTSLYNSRTSYQLSVVLNGDINECRMLYRMDYMPANNHMNKLVNLSKYNERFYKKTDLLNKYMQVLNKSINNVCSCHIHKPTIKYNVIFPNFVHSADAKNYDFKFKSSQEMFDYNIKFSNIDNNNCLFDSKQKAIFSSAKKLKNSMLYDLIEKKEEIR